MAFLRIRKATYREKAEYVKTPPSRKQGLKPKVKKTMVNAVEPAFTPEVAFLRIRKATYKRKAEYVDSPPFDFHMVPQRVITLFHTFFE